MMIPAAEEGIRAIEAAAWSRNWAWGIPLIVITVVIHVAGMGLIRRLASGSRGRRPSLVTIAGATLLICALHGLEASLWAGFYLWLQALPNARIAILFSLNAMTSYGHISVDLQPHWQLMGALEALNGWILFGLTTAFLFALIGRLNPPHEPKKAE